MLRFANAAAYLVTTKKGAIKALPDREQVLELLQARPGFKSLSPVQGQKARLIQER